MAKDKKSAIIYCDVIHTVEELTDEEAGKLFKHFLRYINDLNPVAPDKLTQILFEPIKQTLKRDLVKWQKTSERNRDIALEGWEKRRNANASIGIKNDAKNADSVSDSVNDNDSVSVKEINISFDSFWNLYDKKVGEKSKLNKKWDNLSDKDREQIMRYIPKYKESQPNKKFRKNPDTFFNNKSWLDEIIAPETQKTDQPVYQHKSKPLIDLTK